MATRPFVTRMQVAVIAPNNTSFLADLPRNAGPNNNWSAKPEAGFDGEKK